MHRTRHVALVTGALTLFIGGAGLQANPRPTSGVGQIDAADRPLLLARRSTRRGRTVRARPARSRSPAGRTVRKPAKALRPETLKRPRGRIEIGPRHVYGQPLHNPGGVFLFGRKRVELGTMITERLTYRRELLRTVFPD